jgi:hypothetical protein
MSFRNKKKREFLVRFSFLHLDEYKSFYIFPTQCMYIVFILQHHKIVKFTHKKATKLDILVKFPTGCLQHCSGTNNVYYTSLHIRCWVHGDFIHLVGI